MEIIHSADIKAIIKKQSLSCKEELLIISAFVKLDTLIWIDEYLENLKIKRILVRFRKSDILCGATDFEIITYCLKNNWEIKFDYMLHSKIFVFDKKNFILGSANLTKSGLSLIENANIESVVSGALKDEDYKKIYSIFSNGNSFSKDIIEIMSEELQWANNVSPSKKVDEWSNRLELELLAPNEIILFKEDLLTSENPNKLTKEDKYLMDIKVEGECLTSISDVRAQFVNSKIYSWLKLKLSESDNILYYGELSQILHNNIALNERIHRKEIKFYLTNLLNWINELEIQEIIIDRPNHSQRIRLVI